MRTEEELEEELEEEFITRRHYIDELFKANSAKKNKQQIKKEVRDFIKFCKETYKSTPEFEAWAKKMLEGLEVW